jgi:ElaB/YqjD/DUF883 family membrane-anchored ribosome-binding protein
MKPLGLMNKIDFLFCTLDEFSCSYQCHPARFQQLRVGGYDDLGSVVDCRVGRRPKETSVEDSSPKRGALEAAASEAQRTVDEVRNLLEIATSEDLAERAADVKAKLAEARDTLARAATEAGDTLRPVLAEVEQDFRVEIGVVEQRVRDNPLGALLAAAGLGLLLGLAFSRNR